MGACHEHAGALYQGFKQRFALSIFSALETAEKTNGDIADTVGIAQHLFVITFGDEHRIDVLGLHPASHHSP
nr:hypothetical protein GCM10020185_24970 [Pseudomonas brassicacearum subsp. brassicacearum]